MEFTAEAVIRHLQSEAQRPLKTKELAKALDVGQDDYPEFKDLLARLKAQVRAGERPAALYEAVSGSGRPVSLDGQNRIKLPLEILDEARSLSAHLPRGAELNAALDRLSAICSLLELRAAVAATAAAAVACGRRMRASRASATRPTLFSTRKETRCKPGLY